jgi:eukaryotic-like serine/threonine-protein kinase
MALQPSTRLGPYEIICSIGAGGMGEVYEARDTRLGRLVALKVLPSDLAADPQRKRRFLHEAQAASALNHPNIVTLHDVGCDGGIDYLVMEYVRGKTLDKLIPKDGLDLKEALRCAIEIASAFATAHTSGIIHRDLKAANIMINEGGIVKVLDFGLAKVEEAAAGQYAMTQTETGVILGTAAYMAPEQVQGKVADARSDIFSFGVTLYEMLTGRRPFQRADRALTSAAILLEEPTPLTEVGARFPGELDQVVRRCLNKDPRQRFQHMADLKVALQEVMEDLETGQRVMLGSKPGRLALTPIQAPWRLLVILAGVICVLAGALWWYTRTNQPDRIGSIAVLPFENLSGDPQQEYFVDGMTEGIINALAHVEALRVISQTSAMQYRSTHKSVRVIGRELGVGAIVEGSVLRSKNRVRITAQLVRADLDQQIWARDYERDVDDILGLQAEISRAIAEEIRIKITPGERSAMSTVRSVDPAAFELYLKGRYFWNKRTPEGFDKAVHLFQQSIDRDPTYGLAYAGLADSYAVLSYYQGTPAAKSAPIASALAKRALDIDPSLGEAWATLGYVRYTFEWDWDGAEQAFHRAIQLKPGYAVAHHWYAEELALIGRTAEALAEVQRAEELDPLALFIQTGASFVMRFAGQVDRSIAQLERTLELDPNYPQTHFHLGLSYQQKGMHGRAIEEFQKCISLSLPAPIYLAELAWSYAASSQDVQAREILTQLLALSKSHTVAGEITLVYLGLGENDLGFHWAEKAYQERSVWLPYLNTAPIFTEVRKDARCQNLLRRMGLPGRTSGTSPN